LFGLVAAGLFRAVASDPSAGFELRYIIFGDSFSHCVHGGFGAGRRWHWHGGNFVFERVDLL
jgi:hypothetical protein